MSTSTISKLQLKIGGMSCSFCTEAICKGLSQMAGVHRVNVNLSHEEALIEYDSESSARDGTSRRWPGPL